MKKLSETLKMY